MEVSNVFKSQGVQKGDRMAIFMPPCPLAVASMLACASIIGAVYSIIREGGYHFPQKLLLFLKRIKIWLPFQISLFKFGYES
jgi:acyl-coenzyme A synthetase/AMP-(fatty) acid ligase